MDGGRAKAARMDTPTPLIASLHVALGGAIGAVLRYQTGRGLTHWLGPQTVTAFPWATLTVNIVGSLAMAAQAFIYAAVSVLAGLSALYVGLIAMRVAG